MKIIHKYIVSSYLATFLGALFAITFVVSLGGIFKVVDLIAKGISAAPLARIFFAGLPSAAALAIPLASLISVLLLFGRLSSDGEISAMKACGISLNSVASRPIMAAIFLAIGCLYIHNDLAPKAHLAIKQTIASLSSSSPVDLIEEGRFMPDFVDGITLYVGKKHKGVLSDVRIFDSTDPDFTREIRAKRATITLGNNNAVFLNLKDVSITPFAKDKPDPAYADEWPLRLDNLATSKTYKAKEDDFTFAELAQRIRDTKAFYSHLPKERIPVKNMILRVELNKRLSLSLSCVAFVILGIPLGIKAHRRESSIGIGISLILVMNMYIFVVIAESLAKQPPFHADIIVWAPVVLSTTIGLYMLRRGN
jgi:lipopolysaccharide export system permease protein